MKIAVYTIAKNEEKFVERWAKSCKEADYRLIVDTGSSDNTLLAAAKYGVEVGSISISPWRFDDARNAALALLPDDIDMCIALDMDEVLVPGWRKELEKIKPNTTRPRYKYTWSWVDGKPGLEYGGDKIHVRHGYRWKHPVHEVLIADRIDEVQEWTELEIHHYPDETKSRGQYFSLLELATKEDPLDDRNAFYLAREYFFHGMYDKAADEFKRHLSLPKALWNAERSASMRFLAKCQPDDAKYWLEKAVEESPRREAIIELALFYYRNNDFENCYSRIVDALNITDKPLDYLCEDFAWGYLPYDLAAISAWNLGLKEQAAVYGEKALELNPKDQRLLNNLEYYKNIT